VHRPLAAIFIRRFAGIARRRSREKGAAMSSQPTFVNIGSRRDNELSLVEILDHVLNSGIVLQGSLVISLAGVDLIYLGLSAVITSVETARSGSTKSRLKTGQR
jgi:hypothetical protein